MNRRPPRTREPALQPRARAPSPLGSLLEDARDATAHASGIAVDRERWRRAVGARIASRAEPGRLRGSVLTVYVASAAWAQELSFLTNDILERVVKLGVPAKSLRFLVRPELSQQASPKRPQQQQQQRAPLPDDLRQTLENVDDPELRRTIATAASLSLARSEARVTPPPRAPAPRKRRPVRGG